MMGPRNPICHLHVHVPCTRRRLISAIWAPGCAWHVLLFLVLISASQLMIYMLTLSSRR